MKSKKDFLEYDHQVKIQPKRYINKARLWVVCATCKKVRSITVEKYLIRRRRGVWSCKICVLRRLHVDPIYRNRFRQLHKDTNYYNKVHNKHARERISNSLKKKWEENYEEWVTPRKKRGFRERVKKWSRKYWKQKRDIDEK